jgi:hypothetical protein
LSSTIRTCAMRSSFFWVGDCEEEPASGSKGAFDPDLSTM